MSRSEAHKARNDATRGAFTTLEQTHILPPTSTAVSAQAKALGIPYAVEDIPNSNNAKLHWLGDRTAKKVLLYFHGGGYTMPPIDGHVIFLKTCMDQFLERTKEPLVIAFLEYSLAPAEKFPTQLLQATEALRFVLKKGFKPGDVTVGGDSAGGNLTLGLIAHILHPLEGLIPLTLDEPLAAVLLISPWVGFSDEFQSFGDNTATDIVKPVLLEEMVNAFILPKDRNSWSEPYLAESSFWKGFPARSVLNLWGEIEMLRDPVKTTGKKLSDAGVNIKNVECPLHVHVDCIMDAAAGLEYGLMATEIWEWLATVYS